ncbi:glycerophosphodiester phosphodiesterase family protein [Muribaculum intestinale]|uniref:glycerophosphodiester phosphodiesterase family protein n=1 Tax=Muribaculum intestinale TaxID=1796646 RepID=UPI0025A9F632|nr:glycerophosphodiester phosphodiesterase family protein [Muribaculum intestinale]
MKINTSKKRICIQTIIMIVSVTTVIVSCFAARILGASSEQSYIAHGGGAVDGNMRTNSLEAVEHAISKGVKYIELDLQQTCDGRLVAAHDWCTFNQLTGRDTLSDRVPAYNEFKACRILGRYKPMTYETIDSVFSSNSDIILVTDKIKDIEVLDKFIGQLKDRMLVECFSRKQYDDCIRLGYTPMRSYHNFIPGGLNVVKAGCARYIYQQLIPVTYAIFDNRIITAHDADSIFAADSRVRFVYVDEFD